MSVRDWFVGGYRLYRWIPLPVVIVIMLSGGVVGRSAADPGHPSIGGPAPVAMVQQTVNVTLGEHTFEPTEIAIKSRQVLRLLIKNRGQEVHEFMIGTRIMHSRHRDELRLMIDEGLVSQTHIHHGGLDGDAHDERAHTSRHHYHLNSLLLEPGQTGELIWMFPDEGEILFACNMPGHFEAGMVGRFSFDG